MAIICDGLYFEADAQSAECGLRNVVTRFICVNNCRITSADRDLGWKMRGFEREDEMVVIFG